MNNEIRVDVLNARQAPAGRMQHEQSELDCYSGIMMDHTLHQ